jgi:long-chain acyl-CoA synthetase
MSQTSSAQTGLPDPLQLLTGPGGPFEVTVEEVNGLPTKVYKSRMKSLAQVLEGSKGHGDKVFIVQGQRRITFKEHYARAAGFARACYGRFGLQKGDRVAILSANNPEWSIAFWGTVGSGLVAVPLNAWWKSEELEYALADSGSSLLVCDKRRFDVVKPILRSLPDLRAVLVIGEKAEDLSLTAGQEESGGGSAPALEGFDEAVGESDALPSVEIGEDDYAAIFYTSGTTGKPKGAISTHRNIIANLQNILLIGVLARMLAARSAAASGGGQPPQIPDQMVNLLVVPFFHVTGCFATLVVYLATGNRLVLMEPGKFDPVAAMELIQRERVTSFGGVPTVVQRVVDHPRFDEYDMSSVVQIVFGGAPPPPDLAEKIAKKFPNVKNLGGAGVAYGLTETSSVATLVLGDDYLRRPNSAGKPMPTVEIKIVGPDGQEMPPGQRGEIWIKGPIVSPGYWNKPDETAKTFTEGWLHTGDIGYVDEDGFLFVVDRAKDMIIRGGENIYSIEVEDVIHTHPKVAECAVVGVPDPDWGEVVKAVVVPLPGQDLTEDEIKAHCAAHLADYKVPAIVEIRREPLPRNPAGKVLKPALRGGQTAFATAEESDSAL